MTDAYLIIHRSALPDYFEKILEVRRLMESGQCRDVSQAVRQVGLSRSTYYKYKDAIFAPSDLPGSRKAVLSMMLRHEPGVLSALLSRISQAEASVETITQSPPIRGLASVTITLDVSAMTLAIAALMADLEELSGVENLRLLAIE